MGPWGACWKDVDHAEAHPREFREDVVAVARKGEVPIAEIAKDFGIIRVVPAELAAIADVEDGSAGVERRRSRPSCGSCERRNRLLEQENEVLRRAAAYLSQANLPGK